MVRVHTKNARSGVTGKRARASDDESAPVPMVWEGRRGVESRTRRRRRRRQWEHFSIQREFRRVYGNGPRRDPGGSGCGEGRVPDRRRGGFAFSLARAPPPPPPSPPAPVARARVSTVRRSRARCTRRGGSVCFSASFWRVRVLRSRVSHFVRRHRFCRRAALAVGSSSAAAANPHNARSESTVSVESPGPRWRTVTRCGGVRTNLDGI